MTQAKIFPLILFAALAISCKDNNIVGTWRPTDLPKYPVGPKSHHDSLGDLVILPDSTFLFKGSKIPDSLKIKGFIAGGSLKGTWKRPDPKHIILLPENVDKKFSFGFTFTIFTLDKKNLVIGSTLSSNKMTPRTFIRQ